MFTIKQYNTVPSLEATLLNPAGQPVDLTGSTITFVMRSRDNDTLVITGNALILDAVAGKVVYQWGINDLATHGAFFGEFDVTYSNGSKESFPNADYIPINVVRSAGTAP
jgi:hypothetical protein